MAANELRLDYKDIVGGQLVIVIHGVPTADYDAYTPDPGAVPKPSRAVPEYRRIHRSRSAPLTEEVEAINDATGYAPALFTPLLLGAWRGQERLVLELVAAMMEDAPAEDAGRATALAEYAKAVLWNGLGRYQGAVAAAVRACAQGDLGSFAWAPLELVEAGTRSNARAIAWEAMARLETYARANSTEWAFGIQARSAALLSESDQTEGLYQEAIERLGHLRMSPHLARAQLVYGEWLRRERRRVDARVQLRAAHDTFERVGAEAYAERAYRELLATSETARKRTDEERDVLTPQEAQIARLAREGLSNAEIGAQLFISPRTVQYHLRKVFQKLGIASRNQLGRLSPSLLPTG